MTRVAIHEAKERLEELLRAVDQADVVQRLW